MARHEADREELMREAVAFQRRAKLVVPGEPEPAFVGVRLSGAWSVYFGGDPVFHFNDAGRLRRAFVSGHLFRSQAATLARLTRLRSETATWLVRHDLSMPELAEFRSRAVARLERLAIALRDGTAQVAELIPIDWTFRDEIGAKLTRMLSDGLMLSARLRK